jgi:L-2,4-diaminobutyrate transaminase
MAHESSAAVQSLEQLDRASLLHPFTRADDFAAGRVPGQRIVESASGIRVTDAHGRSVIDGMSGMYCVNVGYGRQQIVDAISQQAAELPYYHIFAGASHPKAILLADKLLELTGGRMKRAFFGLSGSDANETQIKLVWYYHNVIGKPQKKKIIARYRGYHGATTMTASLTGLPNYHSGFDLPFALVKHTLAPDAFWAPETDPQAFSQRCADELEQLILQEGPETVGAFIAEPVVGSGGILPPPAGYWAAIQAVLRKYEVLLIADEVITAFGRVGHMLAIDGYGIEPDLLTLAKGLSSGYAPVSASLVGPKVWQALQDGAKTHGFFAHGYTYSAHPLGAAAALANIRIIEEEGLCANSAEVGAYLQQQLRQRLAGHPLVGDIRGAGLLQAVEFVAEGPPQRRLDPSLKFSAQVASLAMEEGLLARPLPVNDIVGISPPLMLTRSDADQIAEMLHRAISSATQRLSADQRQGGV